MANTDILHELSMLRDQAKASRGLEGLKVTHLERAITEITSLRNEIYILRKQVNVLSAKDRDYRMNPCDCS